MKLASPVIAIKNLTKYVFLFIPIPTEHQKFLWNQWIFS